MKSHKTVSKKSDWQPTKSAAKSGKAANSHNATPHEFSNLPADAMIGNVMRASEPETQGQRVETDAIVQSSFQAPVPSDQPSLQAKLTLGAVGDKYEQEADLVARDVVNRLHAPPADAMPSEEETVQRQPQLQLKGAIAEGGEVSSEFEGEVQRAKTGGKSLAKEVQAKMGQAMGADFSDVRVHENAQSQQLNESIQAKAFTTGQDIFFKQGNYNPESRGGQELLAHELTHVMQQNKDTVQRIDDVKLPEPETQINQGLVNPGLNSGVQNQITSLKVIKQGTVKSDSSPEVKEELNALQVLEDLGQELDLDLEENPEDLQIIQNCPFVQEYIEGETSDFSSISELAVAVSIYLTDREDSSFENNQQIEVVIPKGRKVWQVMDGQEIPKTSQDFELCAIFENGYYKTYKNNEWKFWVKSSDILIPSEVPNNVAPPPLAKAKSLSDLKLGNQNDEQEEKDEKNDAPPLLKSKSTSNSPSVKPNPTIAKEMKISQGKRYWGIIPSKLNTKIKWRTADEDITGTLEAEYDQEDMDWADINGQSFEPDYNSDEFEYSDNQKWIDIRLGKGEKEIIRAKKENVSENKTEHLPIQESLFVEDPKPSHVKQTTIGDCYLEAALASLANQNPNYIKNTLIEEQDKTVTVHFFEKPKNENKFIPKPITVEKSVPVYSETKEKLYAGGAYWVDIIQKAYLLGGFGDNTTDYKTGIGGGGWSDDVFRVLLGQEFTRKKFQEEKSDEEDNSESVVVNQSQCGSYSKEVVELWEQIEKNLASNKPVAVATKVDPFGGTSTVKAPNGETIYGGLAGQHAYTVLKAVKATEGKNIRYWLKIRNPWGDNTRAYTDQKEPTVKGIVDLHKDGIIYLDMSYFLQYFDEADY